MLKQALRGTARKGGNAKAGFDKLRHRGNRRYRMDPPRFELRVAEQVQQRDVRLGAALKSQQVEAGKFG